MIQKNLSYQPVQSLNKRGAVMENKQTKYFWYKCKGKDCNEKIVVAVPLKIFSDAAKSNMPFLIFKNCPKCKHENRIYDNDLNNPLSEAEIKTYKLIEKYKNIKLFKVYWEGEEPK